MGDLDSIRYAAFSILGRVSEQTNARWFSDSARRRGLKPSLRAFWIGLSVSVTFGRMTCITDALVEHSATLVPLVSDQQYCLGDAE
jgi:hypothetical protein